MYDPIMPLCIWKPNELKVTDILVEGVIYSSTEFSTKEGRPQLFTQPTKLRSQHSIPIKSNLSHNLHLHKMRTNFSNFTRLYTQYRIYKVLSIRVVCKNVCFYVSFTSVMYVKVVEQVGLISHKILIYQFLWL